MGKPTYRKTGFKTKTKKTPNCYEKSLRCYLFNSRSICNKLSAINYVLKTESFDIIFICETWLNESILDTEIIYGTNYGILRADRKEKVGGGVAILFNKHISVRHIQLPDILGTLEILFADLYTLSFKYRLCLLCRPPNSSTENDNLLLEALNWSCTTAGKHIHLVIGDFNAPKIKWNKTDFLAPNTFSAECFDYVNKYGFFQLITTPTLGRNMLDLVLCQYPDVIYNIHVDKPFSVADHNSIKFDISFSQGINSENSLIRDFAKGNYDMIALNLMSIN